MFDIDRVNTLLEIARLPTVCVEDAIQRNYSPAAVGLSRLEHKFALTGSDRWAHLRYRTNYPFRQQVRMTLGERLRAVIDHMASGYGSTIRERVR